MMEAIAGGMRCAAMMSSRLMFFIRLQLVFGREVAHGKDLYILLAPIGYMDEHVPEVPDAPRFHDRLFDLLLFLRDQSGTGTIKDVADMCAVFVVSAAEQGGVFVEEHGLDGSKVARQAVDGLAHVIVFQMQDFPGPELVELPFGSSRP